MPEFSANALQSIEPGASLVFTEFPSFVEMGSIFWEPSLNQILLKGTVPTEMGCCVWRNYARFAQYYAQFSANVQIPADGTVGEIGLAIAINGEIIPTSEMIVTPAAVEELQNVSTQVYVPIPKGCCQSISVRNTSDQAIEVQNANLTLFRPDTVWIR
jgi:hypothetical protein